MKIAIPYQNGQVFPHFGHAPQFKFYTIESGMILHTEVVETAGSGHSAVTAFLMRGGVDTLICGSIGAGAQTAVAGANIRLYAGVSGDADQAVLALLAGKLVHDPLLFTAATTTVSTTAAGITATDKEACTMTLTERAAAAAELKTTGQCNCTQSVVKVFEDKLPVEGDTLQMLAAGYAAGMGCLESTCGALIGAVMVAGILTEGRGTPAVARALVRSFEQRCGATICKELKGVATGVPLCPCPECVRNAVLALGDVLPDAVKE